MNNGKGKLCYSIGCTYNCGYGGFGRSECSKSAIECARCPGRVTDFEERVRLKEIEDKLQELIRDSLDIKDETTRIIIGKTIATVQELLEFIKEKHT